jgi:hypothetical protein
MPAIERVQELQRTRGSARLLACWQAPAAGSTALEGVAAAFAGLSEADQAELWARSLRRHGGRPRQPRAITDGVMLPELLRARVPAVAPFAQAGAEVLDA